MNIPIDNIKWALDQGFNIFCASCVHLHIALEKNDNNCGKIKCGGPIFNRDFPDYQGSLSRELAVNICLMCSDNNINYGILLNGKHKFSLCANHYKSFIEAINKSKVGDKNNDALYMEPIVVPLGNMIIDV